MRDAVHEQCWKVHEQCWELENIHALLSATLLLIEEVPTSADRDAQDDWHWKVVRMVQLAEAGVKNATAALRELT